MNVLCHTTYTAPGLDRSWEMNKSQVHLWNEHDVNGLSEDDRKLLCLTRGQSIELVLWLSKTYSTGIPNMPARHLFSIILVDTCKMLCDYKWLVDKKKHLCSPNFTLGRLKTQIHAVLALIMHNKDLSVVKPEQHDWDARRWKVPTDRSACRGILPAHITGFDIRKVSAPPYIRKSQAELFKIGETALDLKFAQRLEVKREIIGMYYNTHAVFNPDVERRCSIAEIELICNTCNCLPLYCYRAIPCKLYPHKWFLIRSFTGIFLIVLLRPSQ